MYNKKRVRTMRHLSKYINTNFRQIGETGLPCVDNILNDEEILNALKQNGLKPPLLMPPFEKGNYASIYAFDVNDVPCEIPFCAQMPIAKFRDALLYIIPDAADLHSRNLVIQSLEARAEALKELKQHIADAIGAIEKTPDSAEEKEWLNNLLSELKEREYNLLCDLQVADFVKINRVVKDMSYNLKKIYLK